MSKNIEVSKKAEADLIEISHYISNELNSPIAAKNTTNAIVDKMNEIAMFPNSGTILNDVPSFRYTSTKNYLIIYRICEHKIYIVRIIHSKRDWLKILFK